MAAPLTIIAILTPSRLLFLAAAALALFFYAFNPPCTGSQIHDVSPPGVRTTAQALYLLLTHYLGNLPSAPLVGWLSDNSRNLQSGLIAGRRKGDLLKVIVDVKLGIILPVELSTRQNGLYEPLPEAVKDQETVLDGQLQPVEIEGRAQDHDPRAHVGLYGIFYSQHHCINIGESSSAHIAISCSCRRAVTAPTFPDYGTNPIVSRKAQD